MCLNKLVNHEPGAGKPEGFVLEACRSNKSAQGDPGESLTWQPGNMMGVSGRKRLVDFANSTDCIAASLARDVTPGKSSVSPRAT